MVSPRKVRRPMSRPERVTHVAFADESHWNEGQYRSICVVSAPRPEAVALHRAIRALVAQAGLLELKWSKIRDATRAQCARKAMDLLVAAACANRARVDAIVWDTEDSRHRVEGRDDVANLGRMYFHLLRNVLTRSWDDSAVWALYPDDHMEMDWATLESCLDRKSVARETGETRWLTDDGSPRSALRDLFRLEKVEGVRSQEFMLVQAADLFAGMAVFSRKKYGEYAAWRTDASGQASLTGRVQPRRTRADLARFGILSFFDDLAKQQDLRISLRKTQGFYTHDPRRPINFWLYQPQGDYDKAPVRPPGS